MRREQTQGEKGLGLAAEGVLRPEGPGENNYLSTLDVSLPVVSSGSEMTWGLTGERPREEGSFRAGGRLSYISTVFLLWK